MKINKARKAPIDAMTVATRLQFWNQFNNKDIVDELNMFGQLGGMRLIYSLHAGLRVMTDTLHTSIASKLGDMFKRPEEGLYSRYKDEMLLDPGENYVDASTGQPIDAKDVLAHGKGDILNVAGGVELLYSTYSQPSFAKSTQALPYLAESIKAAAQAFVMTFLTESADAAVVMHDIVIDELMEKHLTPYGRETWESVGEDMLPHERMRAFGFTVPLGIREPIINFITLHGHHAIYTLSFEDNCFCLNKFAEVGTCMWANGLDRRLSEGIEVAVADVGFLTEATKKALGLQITSTDGDKVLISY